MASPLKHATSCHETPVRCIKEGSGSLSQQPLTSRYFALRNQTRASRKSPIKLVPATAEDYKYNHRDSESDYCYDGAQPDDIEQPWSYVFQRDDNVWIKLCGKWFPGRIWGHRVLKGLTQDRQTEGLYFCVYFWGKARKFVSPLNGDVKPDTAHTRKLLKDAGWTS